MKTSMPGHDDIRIGTLVRAAGAPATIRAILPHGFESFQLTFGSHVASIDLERLAGDTCEELARGSQRAVVSALGIYGNPLTDDATREDWSRLIAAATDFGCNVIGGFAGRTPDRPVPESIGRFREVFSPLARQAADYGVRLALENCDMGGSWDRGDWNIAHSPAAWELIFEAVPDESLGLEWEPCHQMARLVDPIAQLRRWVGKVFHLHGKDASIYWDVLRESGLGGDRNWKDTRTPGFGDTNWTDVISILRQGGYRGSIDIEGWHDPVYRGELEMTGQVRALNYLRACRGGDFVPTPPGHA